MSTGEAVLVGSIDSAYTEDLAFDNHDELFAVDGGLDRLLRIDPTSGVTTVIGPIKHYIASLAFDSAGNLYGIDDDLGTLVNIDKLTGQTTTIGAIGGNRKNITGLAFGSDPFPLAGDLDLDVDVDSADMLWFLNYWTGADYTGVPKRFQQGNVDGDSDVDTSDLLIVMSNWTGALSPVLPIPEPSCAITCLFGLLCFATSLREKRRMRRVS